jgi:hypothetical protein
MKHELYAIWESGKLTYTWHAQLHNYVAMFPSKEAAEKYVHSVKVNRGEIKQS